MLVRPLAPDEVPAARALLAASQLPTADLADAAITLAGAFEDDALRGVIGLQACGRDGLLRSLAVAPDARGRGVAHALCGHVLAEARARGLAAVWLLTTTAAAYFPRLGFVAASRAEAPPAIQATAEFAALCPASAIVMRRAP